jgi:hypothetical protein
MASAETKYGQDNARLPASTMYISNKMLRHELTRDRAQHFIMEWKAGNAGILVIILFSCDSFISGHELSLTGGFKHIFNLNDLFYVKRFIPFFDGSPDINKLRSPKWRIN